MVSTAMLRFGVTILSHILIANDLTDCSVDLGFDSDKFRTCDVFFIDHSLLKECNSSSVSMDDKDQGNSWLRIPARSIDYKTLVRSCGILKNIE